MLERYEVAVISGTVEKSWSYWNESSCACPHSQGEDDEFDLTETNGNRITCNQEKDSVLILKRILRA